MEIALGRRDWAVGAREAIVDAGIAAITRERGDHARRHACDLGLAESAGENQYTRLESGRSGVRGAAAAGRCVEGDCQYIRTRHGPGRARTADLARLGRSLAMYEGLVQRKRYLS